MTNSYHNRPRRGLSVRLKLTKCTWGVMKLNQSTTKRIAVTKDVAKEPPLREYHNIITSQPRCRTRWYQDNKGADGSAQSLCMEISCLSVCIPTHCSALSKLPLAWPVDVLIRAGGAIKTNDTTHDRSAVLYIQCHLDRIVWNISFRPLFYKKTDAGDI